MGFGRIFSREGAVGDFPKIFSRGTKSSEIWFLLLEIEKTTFFASNFKIQGGVLGPPASHSDAHVASLLAPWSCSR